MIEETNARLDRLTNAFLLLVEKVDAQWGVVGCLANKAVDDAPINEEGSAFLSFLVDHLQKHADLNDKIKAGPPKKPNAPD